MNKYFRLCGLVLLLLCPRPALFAQYPDSAVVETHYDSVELNPALLLDSIFKPLQRSRISTGLLMDKSIALLDDAAYAPVGYAQPREATQFFIHYTNKTICL